MPTFRKFKGSDCTAAGEQLKNKKSIGALTPSALRMARKSLENRQ